jgi:hypothetical protein
MTGSDHWTEVLRCPDCALTGVADLSQTRNNSSAVIIDHLPAGFRRVTSEYGDTFYCKTFNRPARADTR